MPKYKYNNETYDIPNEKLEEFLVNYPDAKLLEGETDAYTKNQKPKEELPTAPDAVVEEKIASVTESTLDDSSLEYISKDDPDFLNVKLPSVSPYLNGTVEEIKTYEKQVELDNDARFAAKLKEVVNRQKNPEEYTAEEKVLNSFENMFTNIRKTFPQAAITQGSFFRNVFGDENIDTFVENFGNDTFWGDGIKMALSPAGDIAYDTVLDNISDKGMKDALQDLEILDASIKPTGEVIEGIKKGDASEIIAGIINAPTSIVPSLFQMAAGGGTPVVLFSTFYGDSYKEINDLKAANLGISTTELINKGEDDSLTPLVFSTVMAALERVGLGKITSAAAKKLSGSAMKKLAVFAGAGKAEAITEVLQTSLEKAQGTYGKFRNEQLYTDAAILKGAAAAKASERFIQSLTEQDTWEAGLQGFIGGTMASGGVNRDNLKTLAALRAPVDSKNIEKDLGALTKLHQQKKRARSTAAKEGIQAKIDEINSQVSSRIIRANSVFSKLTPTEISQVNNLNDLSLLQIKRVKALNQEYNDGKIKRKDYLTAMDGFKSSYINAKNEINGIAVNAEEKFKNKSKEFENLETVSDENKAISNANKINTDVVLNSESTPVQVDKAKTELTKDNQGIINTIINNNFNPNLDTDLTKEEFTADVGFEVQALINSYGKNKEGKIAPFGAYLKENLPKRIPGIFNKQIQTTDTGDIIAKVDVSKADQEIDTEVEIDDTVDDVKERVFLSESIPLPDNIKTDVTKVVENLYSKGKIPKIGTKEFNNFIDGAYKNELKPIMAKFIGNNTDASLEIFLRDNFKEIYKGIPQAIINKRFPAFKEPVLDKDGKQVREKTKQGNAVFKKKNITPAEFIKNFLGRDVGTSTKGTRKDALAETLAVVYANEASLDVLQDKDVQKKFKEIESLKPKDAIQKIDDLIKTIDTKFGRKSGKLFVGPNLIADVIAGGLIAAKKILQAGKSVKAAIAKFVEYVKSKLNSEAAADVVSSNIQTLEDLQKLSNKEFKTLLESGIQEAIDTEVDLGKQKVAFFKDLKNINIKNTLDLSRLNFEVNENALDQIKKNRLIKGTNKEQETFIDQGKKVVSAMPEQGKKLFIEGKNGVLLQGLLGFHYRYVGSGKASILYDNISKKVPNWVSKKTKDLFKALPEKIISANDLKSVQKSINEAKTRKEKVEIAKKNLNKIKQHQEDVDGVYYATQSLLSDYVYSAKNEKELIKNIDYIVKIKSTNSNNINGDRALVKVNGFYVGSQGTKVKLEHVKTSSKQSIQGVEQIISGNIDKNITKDFEGVYGFEFDSKGKSTFGFSKIDKSGKTNTSQYYRFNDANDAKNYILAEFGFDGTIADKNILNLVKSKEQASKFNDKILPQVDRLKDGYTLDEVLDQMAKVDNKNVAEELKFSKDADLSKGMNDIIQAKTSIASEKTYSRVKAEVVGASKGKFDFFIPPSAEDFVGLLYKTLGKSKIGDSQMAWYKAHLLNPFARAMDNISRDRVALMNDFKALKKQLNAVPKTLRKQVPGENFTQEQAVRTYIWNKQGMSIPGMSKADLKSLNDFVSSNAELVIFADQLIAMQKGDQYAAPSEGWVAGNIVTDLMEGINTTKRSKYLEVWQQNADQIFSEANLNKLEAAYGKKYRVALENSLQRMKTGKNRSFGGDTLTGRVTDWLTNSIGAIMFFNTRSAVLQTISAINFINFKDNNIFAAGKAFANQPQYWKDFKTLFNSDFLVERRDGLKLNVNEADIAEMAKKDGVKGVISELLRLGFLPTQLADSFAIASGGSTFYRNRIKALEKEGMSKKDAEIKAFQDFRETAEESQQSSRPDRISQQQAGPLGRIILAFANTPAQYARLIKKAASDLKNGRGDAKTNVSKILYYGVAQNLIFNALQQALFGLAFGDEEEEEEKEKKYINVANGMSDSLLRGMGLGGAVFSVLKNTALRLSQESDKKSPKYQDVLQKEILQISPPISSKVGKLKAAGRAYSWNKKDMMTMGWSLDNPAYLAAGQVIAATTNIPLDRAFKKIDNIRNASNSDLEAWQRIASIAGWSAWELGIEEPKEIRKNTMLINSKKMNISGKKMKIKTKKMKIN